MNMLVPIRISVVILTALALSACPFQRNNQRQNDRGGNSTPTPPAAPPNFYVNAPAGADTNSGTQSLPFKTITHAMSLSKNGSTVHVAPGTYDGTNGESFPITVPAGVLMIGDETNKGGGSSPTSIVGGGLAPGSTNDGVTLLPGTGSTIAGFTVTNNNGSFAARRGLILSNNTVTLRNNTITGATHTHGIYVDASSNHVITGNRIVDNAAGTGLGFMKGGAGSKVENNVITGNDLGVEYDVAGGDLGDGSAGSTGGNVISCNTTSDLKATASIAISAGGNFWDQIPPEAGCSAGGDLCLGSATITATPAAQASSPCLPPISPIFYVDMFSPNALDDSATHGTQSLPFKTITYAMTVATTSGATVHVAPGTYDTNGNAETFPITVPAGVLLIGDEANKGGGASPTSILGGGQAPAGFPANLAVAVVPGTGSTVAGFTINNNNGGFAGGRYGVILSNNNATLRNNTVTGPTQAVGVYFGASTNHVISGNRFVDGGAGATGLWFAAGGVGSKLENNIITGNGVGVEYDVAGGDLGGGAAGSAGGNVISCNAFVDLYVVASITVSAAKNLWDHPTPTFACTFGGDDICDGSGAAAIDASNAAQTTTTTPCP